LKGSTRVIFDGATHSQKVAVERNCNNLWVTTVKFYEISMILHE
jgi:hypothetical protein